MLQALKSMLPSRRHSKLNTTVLSSRYSKHYIMHMNAIFHIIMSTKGFVFPCQLKQAALVSQHSLSLNHLVSVGQNKGHKVNNFEDP